MDWLYDSVSVLKWRVFFYRRGSEGGWGWGITLWSWQVRFILQFRSGWRLRQSGVRWEAPAWSFAGTVGPSVAGFFRDRPSPGTWRSSAHQDLTSYLFDYRSSGGRLKDEKDTINIVLHGYSLLQQMEAVESSEIFNWCSIIKRYTS